MPTLRDVDAAEKLQAQTSIKGRREPLVHRKPAESLCNCCQGTLKRQVVIHIPISRALRQQQC